MLFGMNQEQFLSMVRQILTVVGMLAIGLGWLSPEKVAGWTATVLAITGPVFVLGSTIWSLVTHTQANAIKTVANLTEVASSGNVVPIVKSVQLNPAAPSASAIDQATPGNVKVAA